MTRVDVAGYRNRMHTIWRNVQANRQLRPADLINGFRMVQPLRALATPGPQAFDVAHLALEMFTRLHVRYEPRPMDGMSPCASRASVTRHGADAPRVGLFVDAPDHLSGVCMTLAEWRREAVMSGMPLTLHTCSPSVSTNDFVTFRPMGSLGLDAYRGLTLQIPRMDEVFAYIQHMEFDVVHVSTPGPMGLLGLLAARQRGLPVCGTYHTDFPRYARELTGDPQLEETGWQFMRWFYGQLDRVAAPTESIRRELVDHGFDPARLQVVGRGVDTGLFQPEARCNAWRAAHGRGHSLKLLYVGRLSREKNLETLARAFRSLVERRPDLSLVLVGDGPFRAELQNLLAGAPAFFTGTLSGDELARAYASSDLFVFPSKTDTFGRVVLEAQASGLPVVVSSDGGPKDAMLDGRTGVVVPSLDEASLARAIDSLTDDPARMSRFRRAAIAHAATKSHAASFEAFWRLHQFHSERKSQPAPR